MLNIIGDAPVAAAGVFPPARPGAAAGTHAAARHGLEVPHVGRVQGEAQLPVVDPPGEPPWLVGLSKKLG